MNVPLPGGTGDTAYRRVFTDILRPIAAQYEPELLLLSAGYDAHWKDLLGGMHISTSGFAAIVRELRGWADDMCDGRIVAALEGGYHLDALAVSVHATLDVLHDVEADIDDPLGETSDEDTDVEAYLKDVQMALRAD